MRRVAFALLMVAFGLAQGRPAVRLYAQAAAGQVLNGTGILLANAPMFLVPEASRTPLATLPVGTAVRVVGKEGDWYKVIHHDSFLGDRTGDIQAASIRVELAASPPAQGQGAGAPGPVRSQTTARRPAARARRASSWTDRGYISVNGSYQATSSAFTGTSTVIQNVEAGSLTTAYDVGRPPVLDVGGAARVWRNLALGAAVTWSSQTSGGTVSASIPHPFLFGAPRAVAGTVAHIPRREFAVHMNASWVVPAGRRAQIAIFGGPSYFQVRQGLVTDVATSSDYPYDTATFVGATTVQTSQSQLGFNGGLDVSARASKYVGVGAIVRYSRASLQFPVASSQDVTVRAGGLQIGGGIRFAF